MSNFKIVTDTACDLTQQQAKDNDITLVSFFVSTDGKNYVKEDASYNLLEFYETLTNKNNFPKTSLPPVSVYIDAIEPILEQGFDVLAFSLSSKFSGSFQSLTNASSILLEKYPERKIVAIDSMLATCAYGNIVLKACELKNKGVSIDEIAERVNVVKTDSIIYFTVDTLEFLQKGGRIGKGAALAGSILNIKPVLSMFNGEVVPVSKVRGRKKAIVELSNVTKEFFKTRNIGDYEINFVQANCNEDCNMLKAYIKEELNIEQTNPTTLLGPTLGSHVGPLALGISINKKL